MAFDQSGPRWLGISDLIAEPEGPTFISYKVARSRLNRLRFVTQDPERTSVHRDDELRAACFGHDEQPRQYDSQALGLAERVHLDARQERDVD